MSQERNSGFGPQTSDLGAHAQKIAEPVAAVVVTVLKIEEVAEVMQVVYGLMTTDADNYFERADALLVRLSRGSGLPTP